MAVIAFRVDASLQIGTGHVMRCLTLADAVSEKGAKCIFVCRPHQGHLIELITQRGHQALKLPALGQGIKFSLSGAAHAHWLGTDWASDAQDTQHALSILLGKEPVDWLVVDHYALDVGWEQAVSSHYRRIMVIDDLADRLHDCNLLLDQTYGRSLVDYQPLVPEGCQILCGSKYALLRPEFVALREYSLKRRTQPVLRELLITMGGVDTDNFTGAVLEAMQYCNLPEDCRLTVVMGQTAPWLREVNELASTMSRPTRVVVGVSDMAQLMADSDLAIGTAGSSSWERCCLGLPSIMLVAAVNQLEVAKGLVHAGAALLCLSEKELQSQLYILFESLCSDVLKLRFISEAASRVADGTGIDLVSHSMGLARIR